MFHFLQAVNKTSGGSVPLLSCCFQTQWPCLPLLPFSVCNLLFSIWPLDAPEFLSDSCFPVGCFPRPLPHLPLVPWFTPQRCSGPLRCELCHHVIEFQTHFPATCFFLWPYLLLWTFFLQTLSVLVSPSLDILGLDILHFQVWVLFVWTCLFFHRSSGLFVICLWVSVSLSHLFFRTQTVWHSRRPVLAKIQQLLIFLI